MNHSRQESNPEQPGFPFGILKLAPTMDSRQIRRAYFALLEQFPPHLDPAGFARLRQAYEQLSDPSSLARAFLSAPVDIETEIVRYDSLYGEIHSAVGRSQSVQRDATKTNKGFVEYFSQRTLSELTAALAMPTCRPDLTERADLSSDSRPGAASRRRS